MANRYTTELQGSRVAIVDNVQKRTVRAFRQQDAGEAMARAQGFALYDALQVMIQATRFPRDVRLMNAAKSQALGALTGATLFNDEAYPRA